MLEIVLLGTGTAIPIQGHSPAGLLVSADGRRLLFDAGPGTLNRLEQAGVKTDQIDELLLTHFHPDHTLDLATLLLIYNYAPKAGRILPFTITACKGIEDFLQRMYALYPDLPPIGYKLKLHPVRQDEFRIGNIKLRTALTGHTPESVAYRLEYGGSSLVYSGDATPRGDLAELAAGVDLLISECSFPAGWETEEHLNADSLGKLAALAGVRSLVVTHCYPPALEVDLASQIRKHYTGELQLAFDGMRITLSGGS